MHVQGFKAWVGWSMWFEKGSQVNGGCLCQAALAATLVEVLQAAVYIHAPALWSQC